MLGEVHLDYGVAVEVEIHVVEGQLHPWVIRDGFHVVSRTNREARTCCSLSGGIDDSLRGGCGNYVSCCTRELTLILGDDTVLPPVDTMGQASVRESLRRR